MQDRFVWEIGIFQQYNILTCKGEEHEILILSDTHIKAGQSLIEKLPDDLVAIMKNSDILIHAGDFEAVECKGKCYSMR